MKKTRNINIIFSIIGIVLLNISLVLIIYCYIDYKNNNNLISNYFYTQAIEKKEIINDDDFIGILEIPLINLKQGFYDINSKNNNVSKGITILKNSKMPNIEKGILVLASHSGNGIHSYFNKINNLNVNDLLFIYYHDYKYIYEINDIFKTTKNGKLSITYTDKNQLILTTCDKVDKTKQLVIKSQLKEIQSY